MTAFPHALPVYQQGVVVVGSNDGNIVARSEEAKALGIPMGAPIFQYEALIKAQNIAVCSANWSLYGDFSARNAVWLFVRVLTDLDDTEQATLTAICRASPTAQTVYELTQAFLRMLRQREGECLDAWLQQVSESAIPELQPFVQSVIRDKAAVLAGLTLPQNNGMVEGFITKLKLLKRTMYGRAGFALLRQRVLHAA